LVGKRLAKRTVRYYKVRAWRVVNGRRVFSPATYWVSARTWVRGDKYGNLRQVEWERGEKPTVTLGYGGGFFRHPSPTVELTGLPLPARTGCLDVSVRWVQLSGFEVVRMTKPGLFLAYGRSGVARFRAVVHTGQFVTVTATVADFQHPAKLTVPAYMARPEVMAFVNNLFPQPFQQMFDYAVEHEIKGSFRLAENSDELLLGKGQTPPSQEFETLLRAVLENYPYTMLIVCFGKNGIDVHMQRQNQYGYTDSSVITYSADDPRNSSGGLAPHWYLTQNIVIS
jgi:hypothetical protein